MNTRATDGRDWTIGPDRRSNSSLEYQKLVAAVEQLIRDGAHTLINNGPNALARTIVSQLAHIHGLRPDPPECTSPSELRCTDPLCPFNREA